MRPRCASAKRDVKHVRLPKEDGMVPVKGMSRKANCWRMPVRDPSDDGIRPESPKYHKVKDVFKLPRLPREGGMVPVRFMDASPKESTLLICPISRGIVPVRAKLASQKIPSRFSLCSEEGIVPYRVAYCGSALADIARDVKLVQS